MSSRVSARNQSLTVSSSQHSLRSVLRLSVRAHSPEGGVVLSQQQLWDLELEQLYQERETTDPDPEMWRWSPLELSEFDRMLVVARHVLGGLSRLKFCEAGCGIGTKLYLAQHYHDLNAVGYEISYDYITKALGIGVDARYMDLRT